MPKKILVIEDEESIRNIIRVFLEDAGYTVFVAGDGLEGVNKFHEKSPDLVLLDLMLPKMNGFTVCDILRKESRTPIIMLTALDDDDSQLKAVATGNPMIREKMEIDNDVQRLKLLKASYDSQRYSLQDNFMIRFPKLIKAAEEKLACVKEDLKARDAALLTSSEFAITVGNVTFTERTDGGASMLEAVSKCKTGETSPIGSFKGFELLVEKNFMGVNYLVLRGKTEYKAELSTSPVGNMVKLENLFNGIDENIDFLEKKIESYKLDMEASKAEYEKPFAYEEELKSKITCANKGTKRFVCRCVPAVKEGEAYED